jgi:hypothetical protein
MTDPPIGRVREVPFGIDPGFAHNPGVAGIRYAAERDLAEKLRCQYRPRHPLDQGRRRGIARLMQRESCLLLLGVSNYGAAGVSPGAAFK